jgi:hypothetical protein
VLCAFLLVNIVAMTIVFVTHSALGLYWLAFTTYHSIHWVVPIIASIPFGCGVYFAFTSVFTYLVVAYRPVAASAMAGNSFLRSTFGAVFPLFTGAMYKRLGIVSIVCSCRKRIHPDIH